MSTSQNGWPVLAGDSHKLHTWLIPAKNGVISIKLRNGSAGFLIAHFLLWFAERVEPLAGKIVDDWGWAPRPIRGSTVTSNHASGTAADANATQHPLGARLTFLVWQSWRIRRRLKQYGGALRWGGDYRNRADEMHVELDRSLNTAEHVARRLMNTKRGKRILAANPSQRAVILS